MFAEEMNPITAIELPTRLLFARRDGTMTRARGRRALLIWRISTQAWKER